MGIEDAKELAFIYAKVKLSELQVESRKALACGNTEMSDDEILYLKSAYLFALEKLK